MAANSMLTLLKVQPNAGPLVAGCVDDGAAEIFHRLVPQADIRMLSDTRLGSLLDPDAISGAYGDYSSDKFCDVALARFAFIDQLNAEGRAALYIDADIGFQADPAPELAALSKKWRGRIAVQNDLSVNSLAPGRLDRTYAFLLRRRDTAICTGLMYWPPSRGNRSLPQIVIERGLAAPPGWHDQNVVNDLSLSWRQRFVIAPLRRFPNGSLCFETDGRVRPMPGFDGFDISDATAIHANYIIGMAGKRRALNSLGLWLV